MSVSPEVGESNDCLLLLFFFLLVFSFLFLFPLAGGFLIVRMRCSGRVTPGSQLANEVGGLLIVRRGYSGRVTPVSRLANSDLALPW